MVFGFFNAKIGAYWGRILGSFRGVGAILGKKLTVSGLNMTANAFYHPNKV